MICLCLALALPWGGALADALDVPAAAAPQANALEFDGALDSTLLPDAPALEDLPPLNAGEDALTLDAELVAVKYPKQAARMARRRRPFPTVNGTAISI